MGMRRGEHNKGVIRENDAFYAISLGADFTAEHEWGIRGIQSRLGINDDEKILGIRRRRISDGSRVHYVEGDKYVLLFCDGYHTPDELAKNYSPDKLDRMVKEAKHYPFDSDGLSVGKKYDRSGSHIDPDWEFTGAWCENSFGILASKEKLGKEMRQLKEAFDKNDVAIWVGGSAFGFDNGGLVISIESKVPKDKKKQMLDHDKDRRDLKKAAEKTGIKKKIDKVNEDYKKAHPHEAAAFLHAPCSYMALSPAWIGEGFESKHPVMFWLNPNDQQNNGWGWYTVEDLELWIEGKGPIPQEGRAAKTKA